MTNWQNTRQGKKLSQILLHDVGARDGLQMEKQVVPTEQKIKWIEGLILAGMDIIQVGSFVHPTKVPQMADTDALFKHFMLPENRPERTVLSCLVLNEKGLERALAAGADMICMGVSASETHSQKNTGMAIADATQRIIAMAKLAVHEKKRVQVSVQSAFGCGYEGHVPAERVLGIVQRFFDEGLTTISLADTAGHATPDQVERYFSIIRAVDEKIHLACHFHNTYGLALANCHAAMKVGVLYFESSFAGLGGCPFTAIAGGNVCTEDLVHMIQKMNMRQDIKLDTLIAIANDASVYFRRDMPGTVYKTGPIGNKELKRLSQEKHGSMKNT
ncbi:hydroxymethylglutaryl-CoA lyase [bacterium]|nr:MAG: hydroxymethylglutaryl-CoA lyase [bacterium]